MRPLVAALAVAVASSGCFLVQTPCQKVANSICTIPGEERSCEFLKSAPRDNELAQKACTELQPSAEAYARSPDSLVQKAKWLAARAVLATFGFAGEITREATGTKVEKAGKKAAKRLAEAADEAVEAIGEAVDDLKQ
jgi:hypothetical protein